jgi:hypothetical protein
VTWQAPGAPPSDPFAAIEADVRALTSSPWWMGAVPPQRAEAITARMLTGPGEWWLFGLWGRWYRCGMDGAWQLCPPPFDPGARQRYATVPPGASRPPVPPSMLAAGPDLTPGPLAADGLFGAAPAQALLARLRQTLATASGVGAAQFPMHDPQFNPGTPSPVAVCLFAVLWCAGAPVADAAHPIMEMFAPFLTATEPGPRWFAEPTLPLIIGAYTERLRAGDPMGASLIARTLWEAAEAMRADPAFRPRADALSAMAGAALRMIQADHAGVRYGDPAVVAEWLRRCPPDTHVALLRETSPGDHFRLACYDLAAAAAPLPAAAAGPGEARRVAFALLAADLDGAPGSAAAVLPWLDPDGAHTLQTLATPGHPLRALWPAGGALPEAVAGADPQILRGLLAASYAADLAWCRLAGMAPPRPGFTVPAALMTAVAGGPEPGAGLTPWEIIEAARAHLAGQRDGGPAAEPATAAWPSADTSATPTSVQRPSAPTAVESDPGHRPATDPPPPTGAWPEEEPPPTTVQPHPTTGGDEEPGPTPRLVRAYGITFLPGADDVEHLLTELRRRGQWAQSLRGQQVSSASAPAILLVGGVSSGQRRLTRMIARALAEAGVSSGEVRALTAEDLADVDPKTLRDRLAEHAGHTVLLDGLDTLLLDDERGAAYASALYRMRGEGASDVTVAATCAPPRLPELTEATPELIADFRTVRLPDLSDAAVRADLASVLAAERHLRLGAEAWEVLRRDMGVLRGRGRLTGARLVEAYLDRASARHLGQARHTQVFRGSESMPLEAADLEGVAGELEP